MSSSHFSSYVPHHDVGGNESVFGPIPGIGANNVGDLLAWEQQCHSLFAVLASKKILRTDELRRTIESFTPAQYEKWTYYEKWTAAMVSLLIEKGIVAHEDLNEALFGLSNKSGDKTQHLLGDDSPRFQAGDFVRVKKFLSNTEWRRPHIRTPGYIYGVAGVVERVCGRHGDPAFLAFGLNAPIVQLYRVRFRMRDIWPEQLGSSVERSEGDHFIEVEVYEHWLEPTDSGTGHSFENQLLFDHTDGENCQQAHSHSHEHHHHHQEGADEVHAHETRVAVESRAVQREGSPSPGKELFNALFLILVKDGVVTSGEIRLMSERLETASQKLEGASLVVKAWMDPAFEERLLRDPVLAAAELGINTSNPNSPTVLTVLKSTPTNHNLVVCTLCSCYPSGLLGIAPSWYKSREYRSRAVREPRRVLEEFGLNLPTNTTIVVHDSTADHRYIVLPMRPEGTENWSEPQLRALITRDTMIGVAVPRTRYQGSFPGTVTL